MDEKPVDNGEPPSNEKDLKIMVEDLEIEKKKLHEEFNVQRAKMRELFLMKEGECKKYAIEIDSARKELDEVKSQLLVAEYKTENDMFAQKRRAQEEIASLQKLVQDTVEEFSICKTGLERLHEEYERVTQENKDLRELLAHQQQDTPSLAPVISHVKKTLARKLGTDAATTSHDCLDESMRKAQEDAEVLRSLVVPLEEEIEALKEKLRTTDEELQAYRNDVRAVNSSTVQSEGAGQISLNHGISSRELRDEKSDSTIATSLVDVMDCELCKNSGKQLAKVKKLLADEKDKHEKTQKILSDAKEELDKEAVLRRDLEMQWQEKREAHKEQVQQLTEQVKIGAKQLNDLQHQFLSVREEISHHLMRLTTDRENVNKHLETLQNDNDFLAGKYLETAESLQDQPINLPNNVEDLHLLLLKQHDELIQARVGWEFETRKNISYKDEVQVLRDQLENLQADHQTYEKKAQSRNRSLEERVKMLLAQQQDTENRRKEFERKMIDYDKEMSEHRLQLIELRDIKEKFERSNIELKTRIKTLQDELSTSEHVQKDFVKLSQSLQITLEKIRQADTQVRWQEDDDVDSCPICNSTFTVTCRKQHCRHCGIIYCEKCLTKTVPSGPRNKPARVCDICHTLLIPNTAPYFSQAPPQSPT